MASINNITGDKIISRVNNKNYEDGYDRAFNGGGSKEKEKGGRYGDGRTRSDVSDTSCSGLDADKGK